MGGSWLPEAGSLILEPAAGSQTSAAKNNKKRSLWERFFYLVMLVVLVELVGLANLDHIRNGGGGFAMSASPCPP